MFRTLEVFLSRRLPPARKRLPTFVSLLAVAGALAVSCANARPAASHDAEGASTPKAKEPAPVLAEAPKPVLDGASSKAKEAPSAARAAEPQTFASWLKAQLPPGGELEGDADPKVFHVAKDGDTWLTIAKAYLNVSETYMADDFAQEIQKANKGRAYGPKAGDKIAIPNLVHEAFATGDAARLGWPEDKKLRGNYVRGNLAGMKQYVDMLNGMVKRDMNIIVLDSKDYDGPVTYPSKIPLAIEVEATKWTPIKDLARTIRFAHARGIRVASRIACFEDELVAKKRGDISVQSKWGKPYKLGWLDPTNELAQQYVIDLATEAMDAGADEIQLDYVRYPVLGIKGADFHLEEKKLTKIEVITAFVKRVHAITKARGVPLSLDIFGVTAEGKREDIDMLGQEPHLLAQECEALSPMVYPSHYAAGYHGFADPGNHPEIVGIATKNIRKLIADAGVKEGAVIRPWLQAMMWKSSEYGPKYVAEEVRTSEANGSHGWLMWNPGQNYGIVYAAVPPKPQPSKDKSPVATSAR
ncbi:MAG: putative glycoside hydrolase [Polyangiaceae bacterium]